MLDIAYVLMVEEAHSGRTSLGAARQRVDDLLESPEAAARREDKAAMANLMAAGGYIQAPGRPRV